MPTLRPCVDFNAFIRDSKNKKHDPLSRAKQDAADAIWSWLENRANVEASRLCDDSIEDIVRFIFDPVENSQIPVVLTESSETLNPYSAFDKLADAFEKNGVVPVRLNYMATLESFQSSIVAAVLGLSGRGHSVSSSCAQSAVSFKGLDLSIIEDLGGMKSPIVLVIEEADCLDPPSLLLDILLMISSLHTRYRGMISVVIDTRLGIEEIVSDESIFLNLNVASIPLLNSVELNRRIRTIFSHSVLSSSDLEMCGFPLVNFPHKDDLNFLSLELAQISSSPRDLCQQLVLIVANHFRTCDMGSLLMGAFARPLDANTIDDTEDRICEIFSQFWDILQQPIVDAGLGDLIVSSRPRRKTTEEKTSIPPSDFKNLAERITVALTSKQRLATLGRILMNVFRSLSSSGGHVPVPAIVQEIMVYGASVTDRNKLSPVLATLVNRLGLEVEGRVPKGRDTDIAQKIIKLNQQELIPLLVNDIGLDLDTSTFVEMVMVFSDLLGSLRVGEAVKEFTHRVFGIVYETQPFDFIVENQKVFTLLSPRKPVSNFSQKIIDPDLFGNTVNFLRRKKVTKTEILDPGLVELNQMVQAAYQTRVTAGKKNKENADPSCSITKSHFSVEFLLKQFGRDFEIGKALAVMDFLGLVKQPGFIDIASGTVSGTTSAVRIKKMYNDTWFVASAGGADDDDVDE